MTIGSTGNDQPVTNSCVCGSVCVDDGAASETRGFGGKGRQSDQTAHGSRLSHRTNELRARANSITLAIPIVVVACCAMAYLTLRERPEAVNEQAGEGLTPTPTTDL